MEDNDKNIEQSEQVEQAEQAYPQEPVDQSLPAEQSIQEDQAATAQKQTNTYENNIRALREKSERIERERDEYMQRLKSYEEKTNTNSQEDDDFSLEIGENDLAEGKHLSKMQKKWKGQLKKQQEALTKTQKQTENLLIEARLKSEHPDIDKIVTSDNLKRLAEIDPSLAQTLNSSSDYYNKAKAAYTMIKKFGLGVADTFGSDRDTALRNASKPRPLTSVSPQQADSPLSRANAFANGLTDELKTQLRKEMEEAAKNY